MVTLTLVCCAVVALMGSLFLHASVARYEPVRSNSLGPFSVELRRRTLARGHPNRRGGHALAQPCEDRLRVWRVAGLPVWKQSQSVELPLQAAHMMGTLTARDFDLEFSARFREASFAMLVPAWVRRRAHIV